MVQKTTSTSSNENSTAMIPETLTTQQEQRRSYWQALQSLTIHLQGDLVLPGDPEYTAARGVWEGTHDYYPALIVRCKHVSDVIASVTFARDHEMVLSVRSGGHSPAGFSTNTGGIIIDLSQMKALTIDPQRRRARLEAGLTWNEVSEAAQVHGLALTSGDTGAVGVGGLLLGGGIGWMVRKYGLTIDHLQAVELVTAEGQVVRASASEHPDLFWGLRGGGGNFGIATAFEVDLHPAGIVLGGPVIYDAVEAETILPLYARYASGAPDELTSLAMLMVAPPAPFIPASQHGKPILVIEVCYAGDIAEGERVVKPLRNLGTPVSDTIAPLPYAAMFDFTRAAAISGNGQYIRSMFVREFSDEALHTLVAASVSAISPGTIMQLRVLGGAMARGAVDATAFAHRNKQFMVSVFNTQHKGAENALSLACAQQLWKTIKQYGDGAYVNFLADEGPERVREAYPPDTYARLAALKQRYDPTNLFHRNQNIVPAPR